MSLALAESGLSAGRQRLKRVLVLGLGNPILSDDAVGLRVAAEVQRQVSDSADVEVIESSEMRLTLLDLVTGFESLMVVDAVQTGLAAPGFVHQWDESDLKALPPVSPHFLGLGEALALGRLLGLAVPTRVQLFAIEVADPFTLGNSLTPALDRCLPAVVEQVLLLVGSGLGSKG